ncbi:acyltransferase [bacterium]|nr:acyltransferase [bacterium]
MTEHSQSQIAMTPQQRRLAQARVSKFRLYRDLLVGQDASFLFFLGFELYNLFLINLPGSLGYVLRGAFLSLFLSARSKQPTLGRGVTIRHPQRINFGKGVLVDDYAVLDVRKDSAAVEAGIELGDGVLIGRQTIITSKNAKISLGDGVNISSQCRIASQSQITIGKSVLIAAYTYIGPGNHSFDSDDKPLIEQQMEIKGGVTIGDHAWIGAHSTILDGVAIGKNAIIGAHSLVRENVPDNAIVAGSPAKIIKYR